MNIKKLGICFIILLLTAVFIFAVVNKNVYAAETRSMGIGNLTEANLVSAWLLNEESGNIANDIKGNHNGTYNGTTVIDGIHDKGRSFDGVDDYIQFDDPIIPIGAKTIRFKMKSTYLDGLSCIISNSGTNESYGDLIFITNNGNVAWQNNKNLLGDANFYVEGNKNVCDGEWHDVLLTWNGTTDSDTVKIYVDDMFTPDGTGTADVSETNKGDFNLTIGQSIFPHFKGELDEIEIYSEYYVPQVSTIDVEAANYDIPRETEFEVFIVIKEANNIYAEDLNVSFDLNLFDLVSTQPVDPNALKIYHQDFSTPGKVRYMIASKGEGNGLNADVQILKLTFRTRDRDGLGAISVLSGTIADGDGNEMEPTCVGKMFRVRNLGDVNKDGESTIGDLAIAGRLFETSSENWGAFEPDIDLNGSVEDNDLAIIVQKILDNENN
ncbi:LamG-like jellyroll fold domain-containing protein [Wukongibacter baidiensis]|uniref:LamG-like jellyroll fold domain-containing protein n=1 Tax=Wukongibacter baidiensis TaxID=1723361 RepID=UPI003D7F2EBC